MAMPARAKPLCDIESDKTELTDTADRNPALENYLIRQYRVWAESTGVQDWNEALPQLVRAWNIETASE
ncbi:hypothetical protein M3P21_11685 [Ruegeria sp. 2012CJ41-6]|uniref:Uncharacterized protein n=1 Tax=Ruegeria spongiae TaxID=2942209 RepID=A0ABT0Q3L0_9RHOB|nr:hypothetical protein [Ruegeria spongiae]MCL6284187.1 hypothetical protein [Ruegeria spongiae]